MFFNVGVNLILQKMGIFIWFCQKDKLNKDSNSYNQGLMIHMQHYLEIGIPWEEFEYNENLKQPNYYASLLNYIHNTQ